MDPFDLKQWKGFAKALAGESVESTTVHQICIDTRLISSTSSLFVALRGNHEDGHHYLKQAARAGATFALVRDDWHGEKIPHLTMLRVPDPLRALQEIATTYRQQLNTCIIAIVGTHGKTMVKDLLCTMLASTKKVIASPGSYNSQIGVPLSLFNIRQEHEIALIEAAVSQKNEMDHLVSMIMPQHVILTHLGKKHLATFGNQNNLVSEIVKMLKAVSKDGWMLIPNSPLLNLKSVQQYFWNCHSTNIPHAFPINRFAPSLNYRIQFPDGHDYEGKATAGFYYFLDLLNITIKAAWLLGANSESITIAIQQYILEPVRTEIWKSPLGITFINDSHCANPESIDHALKYYGQSVPEGKKVFVFGGIKGKSSSQSLQRVAHAIVKHQVDLLALVGPHNFQDLVNTLKTSSHPIELQHYPSSDEAWSQLKGFIKPQDTVVVKGEQKTTLDTLMEMFSDSIATNQCMINLAAIQSNIDMIRKKMAPNSRLMIMVKAFAYGTDDVRIGKFLSSCGIDILGVSYVDEAVALRRVGVNLALFVIHAPSYEITKIVKWDLEVGVSDTDFIIALNQEAAKQNKKIKVHLHIDTGMSRLGCRPEETLVLAQTIKNCPSLILDGLMTHFACADDPIQDPFTLEQAKRFDEVIHHLKMHGITVPYHHAANSSAVARFSFTQYNMARVGLAVYGLYSSEAVKEALDLKLALSLISRITGINVCKAGETISYGRTYRVEKEVQKIAVLPIGYFDGLHRHYSGKGHVMIRGQKAPMVGKICMDFMMVDMTDIPEASIGDPVLIFGEDEYGNYLAPENLAAQGDSIVYELITCLGPRIQRIFVIEEANQKE